MAEMVTLRFANNVLNNPNKYVVDKGQLSSVEETWERSIKLQGGYFTGKCTITGGIYELNNIFNQWLGFDVTEKIGNITWEGMIYSMELHHNIVRERSLEDVTNAVKVMYGELLENSGFEKLGSGVTFQSWTENIVGLDEIWDEIVVQGTGSHGLRIRTVNSGSTYVYQTVPILPNTTYRLSLYSRGFSFGTGGRYRLWDATNLVDIIPLSNTEVTNENYKKVVNDFITPAGCTEVTIYLIASTTVGENTYFDDVSIRLLEDEKIAMSQTPEATEYSSIQTYGRKENILDGKELGYDGAIALRDTTLAKEAWVKTKRTARGTNPTAFLTLYVCGYIYTTNWVYTSLQQHGSGTPADELIASLLGECQYVQNIVVKANSTEVRLDMSKKKIWDTLKRIVDVGDSGDGGIWRLYMTANRTAVYEKMDMTPKYVMRHGQIYNKLSSRDIITPHRVTPAVVRDYDFVSKYPEPGSIFQDKRDFLLEEATASSKGLQWRIFSI